MTCFAIPNGVHTELDAEGRLVALNERTGNWHALNRVGADLYRELSRAASVDDLVDHVVRRHHGVSPDRVRDDIERMIADLVRRGLLEPADSYTRGPAAVLMATPVEPVGAPRRGRIVTTIAFVVALILLRLPFRTTTNVVGTLKRRLTARDATEAEALSRLASARFVTRHFPGRVACLELSLTAVLAGTFLRQRIDWCFGFATDPQAFHSWIEVAGSPVAGPMDDPILPTYRRVFRV
jgi:hypothetical protein